MLTDSKTDRLLRIIGRCWQLQQFDAASELPMKRSLIKQAGAGLASDVLDPPSPPWTASLAASPSDKTRGGTVRVAFRKANFHVKRKFFLPLRAALAPAVQMLKSCFFWGHSLSWGSGDATVLRIKSGYNACS